MPIEPAWATTAEAAGILEVGDRAQLLAVAEVLQRLHGHSDATIARALGLSRQGYIGKRQGIRRFSASELVALARFYDVPVDLFTLDAEEALRWVLEHRPGVISAAVAMRSSACITAGDSPRIRVICTKDATPRSTLRLCLGLVA